MPHIIVVMNSGSGHDDKEEMASAIRTELEASGQTFEIIRPDPDDIASCIAEAVARSSGAGILVAAGGDGTLNAVASSAIDCGWTLGIIPLGTFNFYARDLGLPLDAAAATRVLTDGLVRSVAVGRINGRLFLNNASFGLYRQLLEDREEMKQRLGRYRLVAAYAAMLTLWHHRRSYRLNVCIDGRDERWRTSMVFLGLNSLQLEKLQLEIAACAKDDRLAVIAPKPLSRWSLLWLAFKGAFGRLKPKEELLCRCASRLTLSWVGHSRGRVAVDGETFECKMPLEVEVLPGALRVLVPRTPEKRE
jgi:diacylglycerol kinase family enzyme